MFIKTLDEIQKKKENPENNTNCPKNKTFFAQSAPPTMCHLILAIVMIPNLERSIMQSHRS
jgi:hypothetical protein